MNEAGYVVCATCGDYAVDFNAVMLDCSTCDNSYHHTCVGMGLGELGRRTAATNAMRKSKSKGKNGGADGDGDVTGTLYDWRCPDCQRQQQPRVPEPDKDKEEVLVIEDTDEEDEDDGERTTYIDLSYNVDIHRVAPSQRALLPTTTTVRRPAVHMQNVAGLLNRSNVGASASTSRASNSNSNIGASTSASKPAPASTSTSTSPTSHNAVPLTPATSATTCNVQTPLSPPPSRSPSRTGPIAPVPFVDFTAMATSSKKRRRPSDEGEGEDERAKKRSRVAGPATLSRTPVEPIDLTLSDDEVLAMPAAPSTSAASVSSAGSRSRHGPGSVSSGTTDIATEDEPVPTRNLMRASLAGRTPRVPLPLAVGARGTAASGSTTRPAVSSSTARLAPSPTASSRSTVPSKRRLSGSPSNSHPASIKRPPVQKHAEEQEDEDDEEHAFFRSRRPSGLGGGGGLTRTRSDAAVLPVSTSTPASRSTVPTRTQSDGALAPSRVAEDTPARIEPGKTSTAVQEGGVASALPSRPPALAPAPAPASNHPPTSSRDTAALPSSSRDPPASSSSSTSRIGAIEAKATQAVTVQDVDLDAGVDDLPDYISDEEHEPEPESTALPAASNASRVSSASTRSSAPAPAAALSLSRAPPATSSSARPTPAPTTNPATATATTFRKPALPPPRAPAAPSTAPIPSTAGVPVNSSTSASQSLPLFLPDSPSPSPERRESQSQRLMSLPPISFLDEEEADEDGQRNERVEDGDMDMDELEEEDELESGFGVGVIRKKKTGLALKTQTKTKDNGKAKARQDGPVDVLAPARDGVKEKALNRTGSQSSTGLRKEKKHREEQEQEDGRTYAQQVVDAMGLPLMRLSALFDREFGAVKKKKGQEREVDADPLARPALGHSASLETMKHADADLSTSGSAKEKKKKHHRDAVDPLAVPSLGLSASATFDKKNKQRHLDTDVGAGESSTSSSAKDKKKKHRAGDEGVDDALSVSALGLSASLEKTKRVVLHMGAGAGVDGGEGESSTSGSTKGKKKQKFRDAAQGVVDPLAVPALGLSTPLEKKTKHKHLDADASVDGGEGEASTSSSVKEKKKKHREGRSSTQGVLRDELDLLARPMFELPGSFKNTAVLGADADAGESSTSSSVKKKKKHRERERDAAERVVDAPAVPSQKTPTFKEPATPDRRVGDLTVSWDRLQELASFSPSSAKKTTTTTQVDVDRDGYSFPSTVREEASSSRQLGRKTARPPLFLDDSPSLPLDKHSASTGRPLATPVPVARFPAAAAAAGPSSTIPTSSSTARPSASTSRPDAEQRKEKQPMQMQRARKTVSRREDAPAQVKARYPVPSSSAVPERTKAAAPDRADAPGKGKSTLDKYSARAVASSSSTVLPPSTSTLPPSSRPSAAVRDPSNSRPSAPSTAPSSSRSKHRVADPSLPFEAPVVPRRKAIAGVDYPLPDLPVSPTKAKSNKKPTARKVPRSALVSDEETPMDIDVDVRVHTSRKGKEKEQAITVDDDYPHKEKARPESRPKPPPTPRLRSASIWSSSTPTPAPYTTSSPSLDAVTAFLKKRRMANPLPSSSTLPSAPTQGQKMAATKRRLERGEHESDLPVPMSVLANAREMQTLRRLVKRSIVVKGEDRVGEVKSDVVTAFDWAKYRAESERKEKEKAEQGAEDFDTT